MDSQVISRSGQYFWVFGFDVTAVQRPNTLSFLQFGFSAIDTKFGNLPSLPSLLQPGNTLGFNLFDVSQGGTSGFQPISAKITFSNAQVDGTGSNPFDPEPIPLSDGSTTTPQTAQGTTVIQVDRAALAATATRSDSVIFGPDLARWNILPPVGIANPGQFLLTVAVVFQAPNSTTQRTFVTDPEMIVGGTPVP